MNSEDIYELLDVSIVNYITLRGHDRPLLFPHIVWNMIAAHSLCQRILRNPEVREDDVFFLLGAWREHQHEGRNVCAAGKVETCVAFAAAQCFWINHRIAFIPCFHRHPAYRLLNPLIQTQLAKQVFLGRIFLGTVACSAELIHIYRYIQRRICLVPNLLIRPVVIIVDAVNDGVEGGIVLSSFKDILCLLMHLPANAVTISACCRDQKEKRLLSRVAGTVCHNIVQQSVWLGVKFVEHNAVNIQTVFGIAFCRQHLVEAVQRSVYQSFLG